MICPDCEMNVEKLNRKGICKACATRESNSKYTGRTYVPLINIKGTKEYDIAMNRRLKNDKLKSSKNNENTINNSNNIDNSNDIQQIYYAKVSKDLENAFNNANISQDYLKHKNITELLELFLNLLNDDDNNYIIQCKQAEQIFNNLYNVYMHEQENISWEDLNKINDIGYAQKALKELRRPTKELLDYYTAMDPLITYLKSDEKFMPILLDTINTLKQKEESHKNPKLYSCVDSNLINNTDLVLTKENKVKLYDCTVWCYNLNGDPNRRLFRANGGIWARSEADAKIRLKSFLKDKFYNVTYKDKDITITEVKSIEEIKELAKKECL